MVRIIISNKVCWGNAETDTAIAPVVVVSIFTDLLLGTQLIQQRNWFISFYNDKNQQQQHLYLRPLFADVCKNLRVTLLGSEKVIKYRSKIGFCIWNVAH